MYIYVYIYISMGWGISRPAFCDISKSHELRQFRVKGLGYISLGFRLPNFPNSAGPSGLALFGKLGNWEVCTCNHFPISQIVLAHLGWGLLGNWEICPSSHFPISQIVLAHLGWGLLETWEIGKYVPVIISQFSNFPSSAEPDGLGCFGKLGIKHDSKMIRMIRASTGSKIPWEDLPGILDLGSQPESKMIPK